MKKTISIILVLCVLLQLLSSCSNVKNNKQTEDDLISKAKLEGEVVVYSISTRIKEASELFEKKYGIKVVWENLDGGELISRVNAEVTSRGKSADVIIAQDSGRLQMELIDAGLVENYIPQNLEGVISRQNLNPLVHQYVNKVFMIGHEFSDEVTNVWQLTEPKYKGKVYFKDPLTEDVNLNFLTMITAPDFAKMLSDSYFELYNKELVLSESCENAGYEFILQMSKNIKLGKSDTSIASIVGNKKAEADTCGLFVYSKTRYSSENNLELVPLVNLQPFCGFMYPVCVMTTKNSPNTSAGKLFIEFLMTEEGFSPWSQNVGSYSSINTVAVNEGDYPLEFWYEKLVIEDGVYISQNIAEMTEFIEGLK